MTDKETVTSWFIATEGLTEASIVEKPSQSALNSLAKILFEARSDSQRLLKILGVEDPDGVKKREVDRAVRRVDGINARHAALGLAQKSGISIRHLRDTLESDLVRGTTDDQGEYGYMDKPDAQRLLAIDNRIAQKKGRDDIFQAMRPEITAEEHDELTRVATGKIPLADTLLACIAAMPLYSKDVAELLASVRKDRSDEISCQLLAEAFLQHAVVKEPGGQ
jgi:hypothetical protein